MGVLFRVLKTIADQNEDSGCLSTTGECYR